MVKLLRENRKALMVGIIGSMIWFFIEYLLSWLSSILISITKSLSTTLYDRLFQEIALGRQDYSFVVYLVLTVGAMVSLLSYYIINWNLKDEGTNDLDIQSSVTFEKVKRTHNFIRVIILILVIPLIFVVVIANIKLSTIQTFEQKIKIITPYTDSRTINLLVSDFARMKSSTDYEIIIDKINKIATDNNLDLPEIKYHLL